MPLTDEEIDEVAEKLATKLGPLITDGEMVLHSMEHEATGSARVVNPAVFTDVSVPCRCFKYEGGDYCWKRGAIGLISPTRNPEQIAHCHIRVPAGEGVARRFARVKGAVGAAHKAWEEKGGTVGSLWEETGKKLEEAGVAL